MAKAAKPPDDDEELEGFTVQFQKIKETRLARDKVRAKPARPQQSQPLPADFFTQSNDSSASTSTRGTERSRGYRVIKGKEKKSKHLPSMDQSAKEGISTGDFGRISGKSKPAAPAPSHSKSERSMGGRSASRSRKAKTKSNSKQKDGGRRKDGGSVFDGLKLWFQAIMSKR